MENGKQSAFPLDGNHTGHPDTIGLTKREYFAGLAMQGLSANEAFQRLDSKQIAEYSIRRADELLKQLEK
jgi:hypothetical protein